MHYQLMTDKIIALYIYIHIFQIFISKNAKVYNIHMSAIFV